jgi:molybdopterin adenylyltransferase
MAPKQHRESAPRSLLIAVVTVSDTRTPDTDESGSLIRTLCERAGHAVTQYRLIPDEPDRLKEVLRDLTSRGEVEAILIDGGTGIAARDTTFEAVASLLERRLDGFGELFRALSYQEIGAAAMLSRAVAGLLSGRPVFSMPGSPAAVRLAMEKLILPELGHVVAEARRGRT